MADATVDQIPSPQPEAEAPTTNVVSPSGDLVSVPNEQLQSALHPVNGFRLATPEDEQAYVKEQKYGGAVNALKAAGNEALSTSTMGLIPGIGKAEDIRGLQEQHPIASIAGGVLPFAAEAIASGGTSAAAGAVRAATTVPRLIGEAGEAAKAASSLTGIGAKALQYATEGAIMQGSSEVSKALLKDPDSSLAHAIASEGAAALFGGALGASVGGIGKAAGLWADRFGAKSTDAVINKGIPDIATQELTSGIEIPDVLKAPLSGDQDAYNKAQVLAKSDATYGRKYQQAVGNLYEQADKRILETLGAEPGMVDNAPNAFEAGSAVRDSIKEGIKAGQELYGPAYDELSKQYKKIPVSADQRAELAGALTKAWSDAGLGGLVGSSESAQMRNALQSVENIDTAEMIKNVHSGVNSVGRNPELTRFAAVTAPVFKDFENNVIDNHLTNIAKGSTRFDVDALNRSLSGALKSGSPESAIESAARLEEGLSSVKAHLDSDADKAADLLQRRKAANAAYKEAMNIMNGLNDSLHMGRFKGTNGFLRSLEEMAPEQIIQRLGTKNRQELTQLLVEKFPSAAEAIKNFHVNDMLHRSQIKGGGGLSSTKFLNTLLDGTKTPEHIQQAIAGSPAALERLSAIKQILNAMPKDGNPSNSAAMINKLWGGKIGALVGGALGVGGHGHIAGGALGAVADKVANEINPFLSYKILEIRGSGKNVVPQQIKAMLDYTQSVARGHNIVNKAVDGVFNSDRKASIVKMPTESELNRFDKYLDQIRKNPEALQKVASDLSDVMPDHMPAMSLSAKSTADYLNSIKPRTSVGTFQDTKVPPSKGQIADYKRQLAIAQQPTAIFQHMKDGTLTPQDLTTLKTCHPAAYQMFQQKILTQLSRPDLKVPYNSRMAMALFLGEPLDSTMRPNSIISAQPVPTPSPQPQGGSNGVQTGSRGSKKALEKASGQYMTPSQSRENERAYKH